MRDAELRRESRLVINGESMVKSGDVDPDAEIDRLSIASRLSKPGHPNPHSSSRYAVEPGATGFDSGICAFIVNI